MLENKTPRDNIGYVEIYVRPSRRKRVKTYIETKLRWNTTNHIHAINQLEEKCSEYNCVHIPLRVAFVDYEEAFDSVQTQAILTSLQKTRIEDVYKQMLKDIYTDS